MDFFRGCLLQVPTPVRFFGKHSVQRRREASSLLLSLMRREEIEDYVRPAMSSGGN